MGMKKRTNNKEQRRPAMKDKNILICVGIIIYIAMSGIDRFVYHIPNIIYIPVAILGIALILIGFFKDKFKQENFDL